MNKTSEEAIEKSRERAQKIEMMIQELTMDQIEKVTGGNFFEDVWKYLVETGANTYLSAASQC